MMLLGSLVFAISSFCALKFRRRKADALLSLIAESDKTLEDQRNRKNQIEYQIKEIQSINATTVSQTNWSKAKERLKDLQLELSKLQAIYDEIYARYRKKKRKEEEEEEERRRRARRSSSSSSFGGGGFGGGSSRSSWGGGGGSFSGGGSSGSW